MKIIVAGAGIGGLTAAACLLKAGFEVSVFEQAQQLSEVGAGIQISANAARVYDHIGVLDQIIAKGCLPESYRFRMFDDGELLQSIPLGQTYSALHGVPYVTIHRADLHKILVHHLQSLAPGAMALTKRVVSFEENMESVSVHFSDGTSAEGDMLVAADGFKSIIRTQMFGDVPAKYTGDAIWRVMVPMHALPREYQATDVDIWVGPRKHAVTYPLRNGELMNFVACIEYDQWDDESWLSAKPWSELRDDFLGWHPIFQEIIQVVERDQCYRWAMMERVPIPNWSSRRVTLLGDAAHPTLPYMAQGAAMAVEDAAVLARALVVQENVPGAIQCYQQNRIGRTTRIVNESSSNRTLFHIPDRDALKNQMAARNMNKERNSWLFNYDPLSVPLA